MDSAVTDLIREITGLVSFPAVGLRVNEMVNEPSTTAVQLGAVISQDPALTAQLLQIANSAAFGLTAQVSTVSRAVTVIGTRLTRDLVLLNSTVYAFDGIPNELISMEDFWCHSVYCGLVARFLAKQRHYENTESLFIAGMLHDIGQLVIFRKHPEASRKALLQSVEGDGGFALHLAEQRIFGFDHAQVGAALLRQWNFPDLLIECTESHHAPLLAKRFPLEAALVHIASSIAQLAEVNSLEETDALATEPEAWKQAGLKKDVIEPAVRAAREQFAEVRDLFL